MEDERFVSARANPRNLGLISSDRPSSSKATASEFTQKPPPPILDRFRALLKEREEEIRVSDEDDEDEDLPAPSMEEIVRMYEEVLAELTFNSKPIITELTIIAGEHKDYGEGIADAICTRILEVPVEQKLPSLYLLDSIVKNIGRDYVSYFAAQLPEVFCEAYRQVQPSLHPSMRHLFGTWSTVFPSSTLRKIEAKLQFSTPVRHQSSSLTPLRTESPSPRPAHGIHVNPKYLEARRQLEHSTMVNALEMDTHTNARLTDFGEGMEINASASPKGWSGASPKFHDVQHSRGVSSSLQIYERKPAIGYGEYDFDHVDVLPPQPGAGRVGSPRFGHSSSIIGAERLLQPPKSKFLRSSSPSNIGPARSLSPPGDGFVRDSSPGRGVETALPSHSTFGFGLGRASDRDGDRKDWWERHWSDDGPRQIETSSAYNLSNGCDQQRPKALIDAYGDYRGKHTSHEKHLKVERLDVNGINSEAAARKWQNSEEEEYVWEDMSPTLADRGRSNNLILSDSSVGNIGMKPSLRRPNAALLDLDFRSSNWPSRAHLPVVDDPAITEDRISTLGVSQYTQEPWHLPHYYSQSSQPYLSSRTRGRDPQMPYSASGMAPSSGYKVPSLIDSTPDTEVPFQRPSSIHSRLGSSSADSFNVEVPASIAAASTIEEHLAKRPRIPTIAPIIWPPVNKSNQFPLLHMLPPQKQIKSQFDSIDVTNSVVNQGSNKSSILSQQQSDVVDRITMFSTKMLPLPHQQGGLIPMNQPGQQNAGFMQPPLLQSQDAQESFIPSAPAQVPSHLVAQSMNHGHPQGHGTFISGILSNPFSGVSSSSVTIHNIPDTSLPVQRGPLPPLPPGPPPASSQMRVMGTPSQNAGPLMSHPPPGSAFSGLISSLVAQGLISLTTPTSSEDSVGVEFNADLLKIRRESAINALYVDLPRQCTTCGLRFKCQEEHSNHMDWHVTKNRISKNRKQKPSRKWFVSAKEWLSGTEALGDVAPGFLPTEAVVEKKADEEMAVPADENQNVCALCGEPFDDFYSDETEEWMYKGAVYLNAPEGSTEGMERSQLGPIVHAKCRTESTSVPPENFGQDEGGSNEEDSLRKRVWS